MFQHKVCRRNLFIFVLGRYVKASCGVLIYKRKTLNQLKFNEITNESLSSNRCRSLSVAAAAVDTSESIYKSRISRSSWSLLCKASTSLLEWSSRSSVTQLESAGRDVYVEGCCSRCRDWTSWIEWIPSSVASISAEYLEGLRLCSRVDSDKCFLFGGAACSDRCSMDNWYAAAAAADDNVAQAFVVELFSSVANELCHRLDDCCLSSQSMSATRFLAWIVSVRRQERQAMFRTFMRRSCYKNFSINKRLSNIPHFLLLLVFIAGSRWNTNGIVLLNVIFMHELEIPEGIRLLWLKI